MGRHERLQAYDLDFGNLRTILIKFGPYLHLNRSLQIFSSSINFLDISLTDPEKKITVERNLLRIDQEPGTNTCSRGFVQGARVSFFFGAGAKDSKAPLRSATTPSRRGKQPHQINARALSCFLI